MKKYCLLLVLFFSCFVVSVSQSSQYITDPLLVKVHSDTMLVIGMDVSLYLPMGHISSLSAVKKKLLGYRHNVIDASIYKEVPLDEFIRDSSQVVVYKSRYDSYLLDQGDYLIIHAVLDNSDVVFDGGIRVGVPKQKVFDYYRIKESSDSINVLQCASGVASVCVKYEFVDGLVSRIVYSSDFYIYSDLNKIGRIQSPQNFKEYDIYDIKTYSYYKEYE